MRSIIAVRRHSNKRHVVVSVRIICLRYRHSALFYIIASDKIDRQ